MPHLSFGADVIPWTLRSSARAKRLRIIVRPDGVEVVAPAGWPMHGPRGVEAFVRGKAEWVRDAVRSVSARAAAPPPPRPACVDGATLLYRGLPIALSVAEMHGSDGRSTRAARASRSARVARVDVDGAAGRPDFAGSGGADGAEPAGRVEVAVHGGVEGAAREAAVREALTAWLRVEALRDGRRWAEAYGVRLGAAPADVRLTNARRRWGSCNAAGVVRLHWRLAQAPPGAFEYVVAHEIAHLAHHDHSPRFWAAVGRIMPGYEGQRAALKAWERTMEGGGWLP